MTVVFDAPELMRDAAWALDSKGLEREATLLREVADLMDEGVASTKTVRHPCAIDQLACCYDENGVCVRCYWGRDGERRRIYRKSRA